MQEIKKHATSCNYMQQINKITQSFPEISGLCYFGKRWAFLDMPDPNQKLLHDLTKASIDISLHAKNEHYTSNSF